MNSKHLRILCEITIIFLNIFSMQKKQKKAFTLVELIVVISILTILATIATIVVTSHISNARDGKRLTDLKTIQDNIEIFSMNKKLPMPDNAIDIKIGASTILYQ
jgi:prepilin-type N-terminal cleavage/methylation domain-containing protein